MTILNFLNKIKCSKTVNFLGLNIKIYDNDLICIKDDNIYEKELTRFHFGELSKFSNDIILQKEFKEFTVCRNNSEYIITFYLDYTKKNSDNLKASINVI